MVSPAAVGCGACTAAVAGLIVVAVLWSFTWGPEVAACSTAVTDATGDGGLVGCEVGVEAGGLAAALVSALADKDILVSIPSKLCIL